jgi:hypothetical protein
MRNYYEYWAQKFIKEGLKSIKVVIGIGISFALGYSVGLTVGVLFFGWVLTDSLIQSK